MAEDDGTRRGGSLWIRLWWDAVFNKEKRDCWCMKSWLRVESLLIYWININRIFSIGAKVGLHTGDLFVEL